MVVDDIRLSDFIFDAGLLSRRDIERAHEAAREREQPLLEVLIHAGFLKEGEVRRAAAHVLGVPFVSLERGAIAPDVLVLLPESLSRAHQVVAFASNERGINVAFLDMDALPLVRQHMPASVRIVPHLTDQASITRALVQYQKHLKETFGTSFSRELSQLNDAYTQDDARVSTDAAVRLADILLSHALHQRADEVHIEPHANTTRVRYRRAGVLHDALSLPPHALAPLATRFKALAGLPLLDMQPARGRFVLMPDGHTNVSVVLATTPIVHMGTPSERMTLSFAHNKEGGALTLPILNLSPRTEDAVRRAISKKEGLILVCGEKGSGVTTMLYALLASMDAVSRSCVSVEEQVSYTLPGVAQMEVHKDMGISAASALRAQLRHAPDVVMIDCALDEDTALLAAEAANRGALVLARVDAPGAAEGIERIRALGVSPSLLEATLLLSIGTMLLPKLCSHCKKEMRLSRAEQTMLEESTNIKEVFAELKQHAVIDVHAAWKDVKLYTAHGCAECDEGYKGAVGVQEALPTSMALKRAIAQGANADAFAAQARQDGVLFFADDILFKAVQGLVSAV